MFLYPVCSYTRYVLITDMFLYPVCSYTRYPLHYVRRYGPLRRMEYLNNTTYCFLTFESIDSCYAAIVDWRGRKLRSGGNNLRVDFSRSGAVDEKRRRVPRDTRGIYEGEVIIKAKPRRS